MPRSCRRSIARERTGQGLPHRRLAVRRLADWMAVPLIHREYTGRDPKRVGLNHATIAPYGAYAVGRRRASSSSRFRPRPNGRASAATCSTGPTWSTIPASPPTAGAPPIATNSTREMTTRSTRFDHVAMAQALRRANIAFGRYNYGRRIRASSAIAPRSRSRRRADRSACRRRRRSFDGEPVDVRARRRRSASTATRSGANSHGGLRRRRAE